MNGFTINRLVGREVWDSRGNPTVEAEIFLKNGSSARAIAPAGASTGSGEATDLRDPDGRGVKTAVGYVNGEIGELLLDRDVRNQEEIDNLLIDLDGTANKSRLGGNAMIATSMAVLAAAARGQDLPLWKHLAGDSRVRLPMPEIQIFGGGAHAGGRIDIQDIMVVPVGAATFDEALRMTSAIYRSAGETMTEAGLRFGVADEGGWWPAFDDNEQALATLVRAIEAARLEPGVDAAISLDIAATEFGANGRYKLALEETELDSDGMITLLGGWIDRYPIISIEDPLAEDDLCGFQRFTEAFGNRVQVVGDDLLVTNANRIRDSSGACNSALIKPNQAGTITETRAALEAAKDAGWKTIISARSGETEDTMISHLSVGWDSGQLKVGSFARSERMAKWNEVLRIEEDLGSEAELARP